jgi:hypothetical protein
VTTAHTTIPAEVRADVETLWNFHQMHHELALADIGIGSHDPGVAVEATGLFHQGMYPLLVFAGANSPTMVDRFPRGATTANTPSNTASRTTRS